MLFPTTCLSYAVEICFQCSNACSGCANVAKTGQEQILQDWRTLFDRIAPLENRRKYAELLRITGGEPTLHPDFSEIIKYIDTFSVPHVTFTNGRWLDPQSVIGALKNCKYFLGLLVSLHGSSTSMHNTFTGGDEAAFKEVCDNIQRAADAGITVFTNTVLTKHNCTHIEQIIAFSQELGAGHAVFNRYLGPPHPIEPTTAQLREAIILIERLQTEGSSCRLGDCVPPCFADNSSDGSNSGIELCAISPNGDVRPDNLTHYTFGNIFDQSIEEIWQSEKAQWYREQLPEGCLECVELSHCRGGARSLMVEYGLEGDPLMREPIHELKPDTIELHPDWKPILPFTIRTEPFGFLICRLNWSVPVSFDAKPLLGALNGEHTLTELQNRFGDAGLDLIGHLYKEGCLEFE